MQILILRILIIITLGLSMLVGALYLEKKKTGSTAGVTSKIHATSTSVTNRIMNAMGSAEMGVEHDPDSMAEMTAKFEEYSGGQDLNSEAAQRAYERAQDIDDLDDVEQFEADLMEMGVIPKNWSEGM